MAETLAPAAAKSPLQVIEEPSGSTPSQRVKKPLAERKLAVLLGQVLFVAITLGAWQLAVNQEVIEERFFGSPVGTYEQFIEMLTEGDLIEQTIATLKAVLVSLAIGVPAGVLLGLVLALSPFLDRVTSPFIVPLNSLPRIAFAPLFLLWFGLTIWAKVALAVSIVVFIMLLNTRAGVRNVEPDLLSVSRLLGLRGWTVMRKVALPFAVPSVMAGFRLCVTYGLLGVVGSEMIAARDGLGLEIVSNSNALNTNGVFAVLVTLALVAVVLGTLTEWLERRLLRWQ
jgi:NitT/TauT family transport system permease protein